MLGVHKEIHTTNEPWLLLPFVYAQREHGVYSEYVHTSSNKAINEVIKQLPSGRADYFKALKKMALSVYNDLNTEGAIYFIDKTPRYYLIIEEIGRIFPDAKFIFLFRNPLATLASMIQSFWGGQIGDYRHRIDIYEGPRLLASGYKTFPHANIKIHYEDLILQPEPTIQLICEYLELSYDERMLSAFSSVHLPGSMGDSIGTKSYRTIDEKPLNKWQSVLGTSYRVTYAKHFLNAIGDSTILALGYRPDRLLDDLNGIEVKPSWGINERYHLLKCSFFSFFEIPMMKKKIKRMFKTRNYSQYIHF